MNESAEMRALDLLNPKLKSVIRDLGYEKLLPIQEKAIPPILNGYNTLVISPTGSGKTEAALLPVTSMILDGGYASKGIKAIYITPLRSLNRDITYRVKKIVTSVGLTLLLRHGDTTAKGRKEFLENPPDFMITTPESLNLLMTIKERRYLWGEVSHIIIDEVQEVIDNKRGVELSLVLERLSALSKNKVQRIGLSATLSDKAKREASRLIGSDARIVEDYSGKRYSFSLSIIQDTNNFWKKSVEQIKSIIAETSGSLLIFTNTRAVAEKLSSELSRDVEGVAVHHGSLSRDVRERAESTFKQGKSRVLIATSSMELGVDIGKVDAVLQFMSPRQVIALLQRVGRAGHRIGDISRGTILTMGNLFEVLESGVIIANAKRKALEDLVMPKKSLDALAHQVVAMVVGGISNNATKIYSIVRRAYPFSTLSNRDLERVLMHLDAVGVIRYDEDSGEIRQTRRTRKYLYGVSMIPSEVVFSVYDISSNTRIGEVSERFVESTMLEQGKEKFRFTLAGKVWEVVDIDYEAEKIEAKPISIEEGSIPVWEGELIPVSFSVSKGVCSIITLGMLDRSKFEGLMAKWGVSREVARNLGGILEETEKVWGREVSFYKPVIENVNGSSILYVCLGSKGNFLLSLILSKLAENRVKLQINYIPYAIIFTSPSGVDGRLIEDAIERLKGLDGPEVVALAQDAVRNSFAYISRFLQVSKRLGVVDPSVKIPFQLGKKIVEAYSSSIVNEETIREIMYDKFDVESVLKFKEGVKEVSVVRLKAPSPITREVLSNPYLKRDLTSNLKELAIDYIIQGLKRNADSKEVLFLCISCGNVWVSSVKGLGLARCPRCKGMMISPMPNSDWGRNAVRLFKEWKSGKIKRLDKSSKKIIDEVMERARLYIDYASQGMGRYVIESLMTQGVGPRAAKRVIEAYIRGGEREFYKALLKAKEDYITYKKYWDSS